MFSPANFVRSCKSHITDSMTMFVYMYTFLCTTQHTMITKYTEEGKVDQIYADKERTVERRGNTASMSRVSKKSNAMIHFKST